MRYSLADHGLVFSTRDRGARMLADLQAKCDGARTVTIDFSDVRSVSYSFVDEFLGQLVQSTAVSPALVNVPPMAARTIERSLRRRGLDPDQVLLQAA
jgi:anti-anti-sigma regulatory factor